MGKIQFKRGVEQNLPALQYGEPAVTLDTEKLFVGGPKGNIELAKASELAQNQTDLYTRGIIANMPPPPLVAVKGDGTDETNIINNIISYANQNGIKRVIFKDGTYFVNAGTTVDGSSGGIHLLDNITLELSDNTVIKALPSSSDYYNIIRGLDNKNIGIIGGMIQGERIDHTGTTGEWGHGINIRGCENVKIKTKVIDCWGDGIYLGKGNNKPCTNVYIEAICENNRRQGMSITHAEKVYIENIQLNTTNGTNPQAGIDIEPNASEFVKKLFINNISCEGNTGAGIQIYAEREGALVEDVFINNAICKNNQYGFLVRKDKVKSVVVNNLTVSSNSVDGVRIAEGSTGVKINTLIAENNNRGISCVGVKDISIYIAKIKNNTNTGIEVSSSCEDISLGNIDIEGSTSSSYLLAIYNSNRIKAEQVKLNKCKEAGIYLSGVTNSEMLNCEFLNTEKYPIRMINSNKNIFFKNVFFDQLFNADNAYAFILVDGTSADNSFENNTARWTIGNKAKYGFQFLTNTKNNYIAFNDFKGAIVQSFSSDSGVENEFISNRTI